MILSFYYLQIVKIENLAHLTELRVLNLAGNEIVNICNVSGMKALAELNLKRNKNSYFFTFPILLMNCPGMGIPFQQTPVISRSF